MQRNPPVRSFVEVLRRAFASAVAGLGVSLCVAPGALGDRVLPLPVSRGELHYDPVAARFEGTMEWEVRAENPLTLLLYPNRYLASAPPDDREVIEAYGSEISDFDRVGLKRHGSLLVRAGSTRVYAKGTCVEALEGGDTPIFEAPLTPVFNSTETAVTFRPPGLPGKLGAGSEAGCRTVRVLFRFQPPFSAGNYGMLSTNLLRFAGPVFPYARGPLFDTRVIVRGFPLSCSDCRQREDGVEVATRTFPSPLLFSRSGTQSRVAFVHGVRVEFVGEESEAVEERVAALLDRLFSENDLLQGLGNSVQPFSMRIHTNLLLKNLAMRQPGEIQLGRGFLKVALPFEKYHEAAFLRVAFQELTYQALLRAAPAQESADLRTLMSLSRLIAEERVASWFASLSEIRDWSERFRYIPFFNDILQGKALVNNDVFLGSEETPGAIDTAPFDAIFPLFKGGELKDRLAFCHDRSLVEGFYVESALLFSRQVDPARFVERWRAVSGGRCTVPFSRYLMQRTEPERIEVTQNHLFGGGNRVRFQRRNEPRLPQDLFRDEGEAPAHDTLRFVVESESAGLKASQQSTSGDEARIIDVPPSGSDATARIDGPNNGSDKDVQVLPRRLDFLLTGIKLRFDSRVGSIEGQQGVQWRARGDKYSRAFTLLVRKEKETYFFDPVFSATIGGITDPTTDLNVDENTLLRLPTQFPINLGVQSELSKHTELWSFVSAGARAVTSSVLVPSGYEILVTLSQSLVREKGKPQGLKTGVASNLYIPVARLTTGVMSLRVGQSPDAEGLGGSGGVPGVAADALVARRFAVLRNELRYVLFYNLKRNIFSTILFEDVVLYAAHNVAVDSDHFRLANPRFNAISSAQFGVQLFGAFFGAKNQSVAFEVARGLETNPRNAYAITVGRSF